MMASFPSPLRALLAASVLALAQLAVPSAQGQPAVQAGAQRNLEGDDDYLVRPGETLNGIAARLLHEGETRRVQRALALHNRLSDADRIHPGQTLRIPRAWLKSQPSSLEVAAVQGDVRSGGRPLATGARLAAGDELRSGGDGYVTLKLADGSTLTLAPSTEVRVERALASPGAGTTDTAVRLEAGRAEAAVQRPTKGGTRFEIRTPIAATAVRGTRFRVAATGTRGGATSEVLEGEVGVSDADNRGSVNVATGHGTRVLAREAPLAPRPLLAAPLLWNGVRLVPRAPASLEFSPLKGAQSYRVLLAASESLNPVLAETLVEAPEVRLAALADGDYFVRVRGIDDIGLEGRDAVARLRVRTRADPPRPTSPPERSRIYGSTVEFAWLADPAAAGYSLQIARDPAFRTLAGEWAELREARYKANGVAPGEYYWRIAGSMADGRLSLYSDPRALSVRPEPLPMHAPVLQDETLGLSVPGRPGQRFEWQIAADAQFARVITERRSDEPAVALPRPAPGTYYLRVRATDPDGAVAPYAAARMLQVPAKPPKPNCLIEGPAGVCAAYGPASAAPR
jgi:hypothetical protein